MKVILDWLTEVSLGLDQSVLDWVCVCVRPVLKKRVTEKCFTIIGIPRDVSFTVVQETFKSVEGIIAVHTLRIWGLTTDKTALAAHLVIGINLCRFVQVTGNSNRNVNILGKSLNVFRIVAEYYILKWEIEIEATEIKRKKSWTGFQLIFSSQCFNCL